VGTRASGWGPGGPGGVPGVPGREGTRASGWSHLRDEILEAGDDVGALELLVVAEATGDHDDGDEGDGEVQLGVVETGSGPLEVGTLKVQASSTHPRPPQVHAS